MINHLRATKTANFHPLKRRLSNAAVDQLFRAVRAAHADVSQNLFSHRRVAADNSRWSAICFTYNRPVGFFEEEAGVTECICGFLLMVEHRDHVAIFKSRLDLPAGFITRYLGRTSADRVDAAVARQDAVFEQIRLRNMSLSKQAMRFKTFEADDLRDVVGTAGSSRYAPQGYRVRSGGNHFSTTPSTGRIAQRSQPVSYLGLVEYAAAVIDDLVGAEANAAPFIRTFARPVDLSSIESITQPSAFAVDIAGLVDAVYERKEVRLVRPQAAGYAMLTKPDTDAVLAELEGVFQVSGRDRLRELRNDAGVVVGAVALNKARVALRRLETPLTLDVEVERTAFGVGQDPNRVSLRRYIDAQDGFILLFSALEFAYIGGSLFRDDSLVDGGADLLRRLRPEPLLAAVTEEKGTFTPAHAAFDADSCFGVVVSHVSAGDDVLVCDDLGDEWADFIGLNNASSPPRITFYHAKHGAPSLGAGPFHVAIAQALKNLRRMSLPVDAVRRKVPGWRRRYISGGGVHTAIPRLVRGHRQQLPGGFEPARNAPDAVRRVMIVTSSLSYAAVEQTLTDIAAGQRPDPYFVQLYWLLLSYFSGCTDMGATGYVVCQL